MQLSVPLHPHWLEQGKAEHSLERQNILRKGRTLKAENPTGKAEHATGKAAIPLERQSIPVDCIRHDGFVYELYRLEQY